VTTLGRHLLGLREATRDQIELVLDNARAMAQVNERRIKKVPTLRGLTIVNLFLENSTRTRVSFEIAAKRLSADSVNVSAGGSSVAKGETIVDTARNLEAMAVDCIVVRDSHSGAPHQLARRLDIPVVNAGDGTNEHPSQGLLDLFTIREKLGKLDGLKIAIVGDVLHSRVARSNMFALRHYGADVRLSGPATLMPPDPSLFGARYYPDMNEAIAGADVIMMLRIQLERQKGANIPSLREYSTLYGLNAGRLRRHAKEGVVVLHPGPINRGVELSPDVADGPWSLVLDQVSSGVAVRMAVLHLMLGGGSLE
jgi:aspartate carbamoyltransferase catalytic subunit